MRQFLVRVVSFRVVFNGNDLASLMSTRVNNSGNLALKLRINIG